MTTLEMLSLASSEDFTKAVHIKTDQIVFNPNFRLFCEENTCGNYGRNYGCPPDCGTPEQMKTKAQSFQDAIVFQTNMLVEDVDDSEINLAIKKEHARKTRHLIAQYQKAGIEGAAVLPGPCTLCTVCSKIEGAPCRILSQQSSCLSAYCIDVTKLAETCCMNLDWSGNTVSYFSIYLYTESTPQII